MLRRALLWALSVVALLALIGVGGTYWLGKRAEPSYTGRVALQGLSAPVQARFGPHAVPTIEASRLEDLVLAQGYVVASERLWQMDLLRRLASGQLAELFGPKAVPTDRFFRTMGLRVQARRSFEDLGALDQALLDAYAAGVNAYIETAKRRLPLEYLIARASPAPWTAEDSLSIGAYMAWTQSFNARAELTFLRVAERIGAERARELFPTDDGIAAPPVAAQMAEYVEAHRSQLLAEVDLGRLDAVLRAPLDLGLPAAGAASNAWLVSGPKTPQGVAMLANDPHLAASAPSIWYELELKAPDLHVAGVALPGVPLILIGHNEDLAWGITTVIADNQDIFVEQVTPDGAHVVREGAEPEPIETRWEDVLVKGQKPVQVMIRSTSRGVVLNDVLGPTTGTAMDLPQSDLNDLLVLRQAFDAPDRSFQGVRRLSQAKTLAAAKAAGLDFRHVVSNLMLAHKDGSIAWQMTGMLPRRGKGNGAFPVPGWVDAYDWQGLSPQGLNPTYEDPVAGVLLNANNRSVGPDYPARVSTAWSSPNRAYRIAERLAELATVTESDMASIQADRVSLKGQLMRTALLEMKQEIQALDRAAWDFVDTLIRGWSGGMEADSPAAALIAVLEPALYHALYGDELGDDLPALMSLAVVHYNALDETLRTGESGFWDDIGTPHVETRADIWVRAIRRARAQLESYADRADASGPVTLGQVRSITFPHAFQRLPLLGDLFSVGPVPIGGSTDTIDVAKTLPQEPDKVLFAPSMRVIATPDDWTRTGGTLPLGQSGHLFSPYRTDQLADWLAVAQHAWPWGGPARSQTFGELTLTPSLEP